MLDDRRARVLEALVEEYIATGMPVSSQAIVERSGLPVSSATVRNDVARLEAYGFVEQPHTSAGRVPTAAGYRFYVDHASPARLRSATRSRINAFFSEVHQELSRVLKETTGLLAEVSHFPAVVIGPGLAGETVRALHLVSLGGAVVLAVAVTGSGRVTQDVVRLEAAPDRSQLADAERLLSVAYEGRTVADGGVQLAAVAPDAASPQVHALLAAVATALGRSDRASNEIYVGGTSQLVELWQDLAHVHAILAILEQEATVRRIIDTESPGTSVRLGVEIDVADLDLAIVSSSYEAGEHGSGRLAVLGPMRMDYRRTMRIVEEVGGSLGDSLGG
ncbi:MAG: heat-inducible transcriptional repressor HrcA [Actinomycetota bacterium]|nr:heat-inducible transcriptional repressor HrcA [Actinomycetota bacterium]